MRPRWLNFTLREFRCKHCGENRINPYFIDRLQRARTRAGVGFTINSGYRCPAYNRSKDVGGVKGSAHERGEAADIKVLSSRRRFIIVAALLWAGFNRIGIGKTFVHADADCSKPQEVCWLY